MTARWIAAKSPPPTESRKSVSPEKTSSSPLPSRDDEADHVVASGPGVGIASTSSPPAAQRAGDDRQPELALVDDVVDVGVRAQDVGRGQLVLAGEGEQRLERRARVDEDGGAARLVADDVGVREVPRIAGSARRSTGR